MINSQLITNHYDSITIKQIYNVNKINFIICRVKYTKEVKLVENILINLL